MKKRWRNACIGLIGLLITFQTQAQASYPLKKIGKWENESDLAYYYASYASPLLIINTTVYLPHDKCVEVRSYGGSYATKDLEGNIIIKSEGADSAEKEMEGAQDEKSHGVDSDAKTGSGDEARKSRGAEMEQKDQSGVIVQRQQEEEIAIRSGDGASDVKDMSGTDAEKVMEGTQEIRTGSAAGNQKTFGGVTLYIRCMPNNDKLDLTNFFGRGSLYLYDIHGMRAVNAVDIIYEE